MLLFYLCSARSRCFLRHKRRPHSRQTFERVRQFARSAAGNIAVARWLEQTRLPLPSLELCIYWCVRAVRRAENAHCMNRFDSMKAGNVRFLDCTGNCTTGLPTTFCLIVLHFSRRAIQSSTSLVRFDSPVDESRAAASSLIVRSRVNWFVDGRAVNERNQFFVCLFGRPTTSLDIYARAWKQIERDEHSKRMAHRNGNDL